MTSASETTRPEISTSEPLSRHLPGILRHPAVLLRASAGSGKTTRLALRLLALLVAGVQPRTILATTFTKKAAGEIVTRVFERLAKAVLDESEGRRLAAQLELSDSEARIFDGVLLRLVEQQHNLRIGTIDSWALQLLRMFHVELGMPASVCPSMPVLDRLVDARALSDLFEQLPEEAAVAIAGVLDADLPRRSIISRAIRVLREGNLLLNLAPVHAWQGAVTIVDGLSAPTASFYEILADFGQAPLPFNKKGEINKHWERARLQILNAADGNDWERIVTNFVLKVAKEGETYYGIEPSPEIRKACSEILALAREDIASAMSSRLRTIEQVLNVFAARILERQRLNGALAFDDIKTSLASRRIPSLLPEIAYRIDGAIHHLLLDEFQDTSLSDWALIAPLAEEILAQADGNRTFFCVGDEKQAIYGWRGGTTATFATLEERYGQNGLKMEQLSHCYRCAPQIISFVNHTFNNLMDLVGDTERLQPAQHFAGVFSEHVAGKEIPGFVQVLRSSGGDGGENVAADETNELSGSSYVGELTFATWHLAAEEIKKIHTEFPQVEIGVLFRTNRDATAFARLLNSAPYHIEASEESSEELGRDPGVAALLALLVFIEHPADTANIFLISLTPLGAALGIEHGSPPKQLESIRRRLAIEIRCLGLPNALSKWSNLLATSTFNYDDSRVEELVVLATTMIETRGPRLDTFITLAKHHPVERSSRARVRIITIHRSKGLEFDVVVLPHPSQANIPPRSFERPAFLHNLSPSNISSDRADSGPHSSTAHAAEAIVLPYPKDFIRRLFPRIDELYQQERSKEVYEEICLLYVALTRAKFGLIIVTEDGDVLSDESSKASQSRSSQGKILSNSWRSFCSLNKCDETAPFGDLATALCHAQETSEAGKLRVKVTARGSSEEVLLPISFRPIPDTALRRAPKIIPSTGGGNTTPLRELPPDPHALLFGNQVHAALATVEWLTNGEASSSIGQDTPASELISRTLKIPIFGALFDRKLFADFPLSVWRERPFAILQGENARGEKIQGHDILQGKFDRVMLHREANKAVIIDFKVHKQDDSIPDLVANYRPQLLLYGKSLKTLLFSEQLSPALLLAFLPSGEVWQVFADSEARSETGPARADNAGETSAREISSIATLQEFLSR